MTICVDNTVSNFIKWLDDVSFVFFPSHLLEPCVCVIFVAVFVNMGQFSVIQTS
jgi:hypothetical protein